MFDLKNENFAVSVLICIVLRPYNYLIIQKSIFLYFRAYLNVNRQLYEYKRAKKNSNKGAQFVTLSKYHNASKKCERLVIVS